MRLVHLAAYDGPYPGSTIPMIVRALREARERGWEAEAVFAETAREQPWLELFSAHDLPVRIIERDGHTRLTRRLRELVAESPEEPTILHTHFTAYDLAAVVASRSRPRTAVFWHLHTPPETRTAVRARGRLKFGLLGRRAHAILCVAPHLAETVAALSPPGKVRFFPNGIDTDAHAPADAPQREAARRGFGLDGGAPVIGHLGWDWPVKGGDLLLAAVARLREGGSDVRMVTRADDPQALADVERFGVEDAVTVVERLERVQDLFAAADLFLSPSRKEGMPFSVLEALLSGVPVVASDIPGHAMIAREYPGVDLTATDPEALADAVAHALGRDRAESAARTADAARLITEKMGLEAWVQRLFSLYDEVGPSSSD